MRHVGRAAGLVAAMAALTTTTACSSSDATERAAASSSSAAAAASAAATAAPGSYGSPVNPSLPNPTDVATDTPVITDVATGVVSISSAEWDTAAAQVEVDGLVPDVIESKGTCTLTLTRGGDTVRATTPGVPDASSTSCASLAVPGTQLTPGTWTAVLSYESSVSTASSAPVEVEVP